MLVATWAGCSSCSSLYIRAYVAQLYACTCPRLECLSNRNANMVPQNLEWSRQASCQEACWASTLYLCGTSNGPRCSRRQAVSMLIRHPRLSVQSTASCSQVGYRTYMASPGLKMSRNLHFQNGSRCLHPHQSGRSKSADRRFLFRRTQ